MHRFQWLKDEEIGALPVAWNYLIGEYPKEENAHLYHHTLGSPGFKYYSKCHSSKEWNCYLLNALNMIGERPTEIVRRAYWGSNGGNNKLFDATNGSSRLSGEVGSDHVHPELCTECREQAVSDVEPPQ